VRLNAAAVQGIWASLSTDLLFLSSDDDERYNIQANTKLLKNLTIQAAATPIGYPLFQKSTEMF
jgi:hypothetical protein